MTSLPQDDELSSLLDDLDDLDDAVEIIKPANKPPKTTIINETINETEDEGDYDESIPEHDMDPEPEVSEYNDKLLDSSINELLSNYRKDRKDIDYLIKYLWGKLKKKEPSRVMFETLAVSLRTKSEANSNLLKLIDIMNKRKDTETIDGLDLEGLLDD